MAKTFLTVGATTTESIDSRQPVWVLLPETSAPAVVSTYARQIYPGMQVLLWLGSVRHLFNDHFWPHFHVQQELTLAQRKPEYAAVRAEIAAFVGDAHKRAQIFLSYLSARRRIEFRLNAIIEKVAQRAALTRRDTAPLIDAVLATIQSDKDSVGEHKAKFHDFIETGGGDTPTLLWLALCVDPRFALHLWRDAMAAEARPSTDRETLQAQAALQPALRRAIETIRAGGNCAQEVGGVDLAAWLAALIGCAPQQRFFAAAAQCHEGFNKAGCLKFDVSESFRDFGEGAPRFIALDKLSRAVTAFDRTLSHLAIRFATDNPEMKRLSENHLLHSGLLVRGLIGDNEAMRVLYPAHMTGIASHSALSERLVEKTRAAVADGSLAEVCARYWGLSTAQLQRGIERLIAIQRATLPLLPVEVHHLADAIESRLRLRRASETLAPK